ncbi:MAG TPA: FtsX-like permease family protein [Candidatus Blautia pullicola]|uniref:FtsX-like permease family protein n=1 Tax=Candidatus Blautia pullicola TaxID=2838498 RepID=A0A9D2JRR1_9FIRM|nr:FtsX-like permease family protein [Candidatus Blautia pullicola]
MRKKALHKDIRQEIKRTLPRFLSLFLMSALGVSFFSGVRASMPDMLSTTDGYLDDTGLFDLQAVSTMGLQEEDLEAVLDTEGVQEAELSYSSDYLCDSEGEQYVVHLMAQSDMAKCQAEEGRLPEKADEIFLDTELAQALGCQIGDKITLYEEEQEGDKPEGLAYGEFEITGIGSSPMYLSINRGSASVGNGQVTGFAVVLPEAFDMEVYTQMNIRLEGAGTLECYSDEYKELVSSVQDTLEETAGVQCQWRYDQIYDEAQGELADARAELEDGRATAQQELADARKTLDDGWAKVNDGEKQLADGKQQLADSEAQLNQSQQEIDDAKAQMESAKAQAEEGAAQVRAGWAEIEANEAQLNDSEQLLSEKKAELEQGAAELEAGKAQLSAQEEVLNQSQSELEAGKTQLAQMEGALETLRTAVSEQEGAIGGLESQAAAIQGQIDQLQASLGTSSDPENPDGDSSNDEEILAQIGELEAQKAALETEIQNLTVSLEETRAQLSAQETALTPQIQQLQQVIAQGEAQLSEGRNQLETARAQLEESEAQITAGREEIAQGEAAIAQGRQELEAAKAQLQAAQAEVDSGQAQIAAYEQQIADGEAQIASGRAQLEEARAQLPEQEQELADARKELEDGEADYLEGKEEAEAQIADGEQQIADAEAELADLEQPEWYLNTRDDVVEDYGEMEDNAAQIGAIGRVFPLMFFLVAALVSLTTMTRMVEEQRGHIGTMKALGYSKKDIAMKYLFYAGSATLSGGAVGILVGQKLFPYVIQVSYGIMYDCLKQPDIPYRPVFAIQAMLISFVCIMLATGLSCMNELRESPAELMRPAAPKVGKRVLLEYIPLIWKRLNFTTKSTFRNIFRYKKRLFMTIFGISATMALLVTGFGLRDSIIDLAEIQYDNIQLYDAMITFSGTDEEKKDLGQWLEDEKDVAASTMVHMEMVDVSTEEGNGEVYLCVPENKEDFQTMTVLQNRTSEEVYTLDGEGILLTEWMADTLGVSAGDSITMEKEDGSSSQEVQVMGVVENYIMNYAYMSPEYYEKIYGEPAEFEVMYAEFTPEGQEREKELGSEILQQPGVYNVSYTSDTKREINDMLQALVLVIIVLIITAALLAFVVLYNLNNVNITERRRELATLKVLGFYDQEVAAYVYHENIILTLMGIVVGVGLGTLLHQYIIHTIRVDMVMFGQHVSLVSFLISAVLTAVFSAFVNFVMYFKLKEINMVESLKSVE